MELEQTSRNTQSKQRTGAQEQAIIGTSTRRTIFHSFLQLNVGEAARIRHHKQAANEKSKRAVCSSHRHYEHGNQRDYPEATK